MFTHVVFFKFEEQTHAAEAKARLSAMKGKIPSLRHLEVGLDVLRSERSYDLCLITRFDDRAGMDAYQVHPVHQDVVKYIKSVARAVVAVDYLAG